MMLNTETENRIIGAAEKLFYQNGKAGTSMQDIADEAGINRTLLNYYFRSKDLLFEAVFRKAMNKFVPELVILMKSEMTFTEYVPKMVNTIIDTMLENPQIPIFVLQELSSNPNRMPEIILKLGIEPEIAFKKFKKEREMGKLPDIDPRQIIMNILSLCIFPFAARPVVTSLLYYNDDKAYIEAMKERKKVLPALILSTLKSNYKS